MSDLFSVMCPSVSLASSYMSLTLLHMITRPPAHCPLCTTASTMSPTRSTALDTFHAHTPIPTNLLSDPAPTPIFSRPCARDRPCLERRLLDPLNGPVHFLVFVPVRTGTAVLLDASRVTRHHFSLSCWTGSGCPEPRGGMPCHFRRARREDDNCSGF